MSTITKPMLGRSPTNRGSEGSDLEHDIATEYRRRVGAYIREHRLKAGLTQDALARLLAMGHSAISALELGRSTVSPEKYHELAKLLNLNERQMGEFLLRWTNPWLFAMIYGLSDTKLASDIRRLPTRTGRAHD